MTLDEALARVRENMRSGAELRDGVPAHLWQALLDRYSDFVDSRDPDGYLTRGLIRLTSCRTPRPHLHLMASCHEAERGIWGSFWDQFGGGFSCVDSVMAGRMTSHLDTNYVPTAPEPQDSRGFYVHEDGNAWAMFPRSGTDEGGYDGFACEQGLDRHTVRAARAGLASVLEVCVHPRLPLEVWRVRIANGSGGARSFSWFCRLRVSIDSYPFYYFVPRVVCEGTVEDGALVFLNHDQGNTAPRQSFFVTSPQSDGFDMMGELFEGIGGRGSLPEAVVRGECRDSLGLQPYAGLVAAAQFRAELAPGESREWTCAYGACPRNPGERRAFIERVRAEVMSSPPAVWAELDRVWERKIGVLKIKTPDAELDRYFNVWSRYQARNQARLCRALDKVGYRDLMQDLLSVCDAEAGYVRAMLLRALRYQLPDGRAIRQFGKFPGGGHDMRMYMDSASWIPDLVVHYLRESGDFALLDEEAPFFDAAASKPDPGNTATVYEHALRAVRSLTGHTGYHGLCSIGYGDWNDALSGIGGERGASVWLSCACVHAAKLMAELADYLGRAEDAGEMLSSAETMTGRINEHAWDGEWYIYALNGAGEPIGSSRSAEGSIHLNVNAWALFTGVAAAAGREEAVWNAIRRLETPLGHVLLAPPYTRASRASVGRIADQIPGMFENGSIYTHGEAFYLHALMAGGRADRCYREIRRSLPSSQVPDLATGPRHQQSNFTVGPDHPNYGQQLFSNFTGSLAWLRRVIEWMVGVRADFGSLVVDPRPPSEWPGYEVFKVWRGRRVRVKCRRGGAPGRVVLGDREYGPAGTEPPRGFPARIPLERLREDVENVIHAAY